MCRSKDSDCTDIVVGDLGFSKFTTPQEIMNLSCGTLAYVAPEVLFIYLFIYLFFNI